MPSILAVVYEARVSDVFLNERQGTRCRAKFLQHSNLLIPTAFIKFQILFHLLNLSCK